MDINLIEKNFWEIWKEGDNLKKIFFILVIALAGTLAVISVNTNAFNNNPYEGQYVSRDNSNITLKLDSNNKCTMTYTLYKDAECTDGKYEVNDNKINITFDSKKDNYCGASSLQGEVEGSRIKVYSSLDNKYLVFLKE
ncbi:MAG: hypothetical protein Q8900_02755 [Bacillota bacterium]|nr:hypothetical protein [Bacillota bacterium]